MQDIVGGGVQGKGRLVRRAQSPRLTVLHLPPGELDKVCRTLRSQIWPAATSTDGIDQSPAENRHAIAKGNREQERQAFGVPA